MPPGPSLQTEDTVPAYIRIRREDGGWRASGTVACELGHRLEARPGEAADGVYAGWAWDGDTLVARNDRFGFLPLYYQSDASGIVLSPSLRALLAQGASAALDYPALAVYFRLGCFLACDTPFLSVRVLPPAATFRWRDGRLELADGMRHPAPNPLGREAALDGYVELFRAAVRRRQPPAAGFAVPLSGGRDSRHILFELVEAGMRPDLCVTASYFSSRNSGDSEVATAALLSARLGIPHEVVKQPPGRLAAERRAVRETDFASPDSAWMLAVGDRLAGRVGALYDGIAGDVLSAGLFLDSRRMRLHGEGRLEELAQDLLGEEWDTRTLGAEARNRLGREAAAERLVRELARHSSAPNPVASFIFWNRTRRHISASPFRILSRVGTVFAPYLDHAVFDHLAGLPPETFLDRTFHTEAIARAHPRHAEIPYAKKEARRTPEGARAQRRFAAEMLGYVLTGGPARLASRGYFVPRLLRCLADPGYRSAVDWLGPLLAYLGELECAAELADPGPSRGA